MIKGNAIRLLTKHANIDLKDTIAFGDGNNDVSMLKLVHCGIAMGNGTEEAKQAADFVTDSIFDDGIYKALIRLNLANPPIPKANGYKNQTKKRYLMVPFFIITLICCNVYLPPNKA